jgi:hypothetical protein
VTTLDALMSLQLVANDKNVCLCYVDIGGENELSSSLLEADLIASVCPYAEYLFGSAVLYNSHNSNREIIVESAQ